MTEKQPLDEDDALQRKMRDVLNALNKNYDQTGEDVWVGKPDQEPLPITFPPVATSDLSAAEIITIPKDHPVVEGDGIETLLYTYMQAVREYRQLDSCPTPQASETVSSTAVVSSSNARTEPSPRKYDDMSLGELLNALDDMTP